jgi:flagellar biogenesis protein FliO
MTVPPPGPGCAQPARAAASVPIPFQAEDRSASQLSWQAGLSLLLCLVLAVAASYWLKRRMGGPALPGGARLQLLEVRRIDRRSSLVVARWGDELLLLGGGGEHMTVLARRRADDDGAAPAAPPAPAVWDRPL